MREQKTIQFNEINLYHQNSASFFFFLQKNGLFSLRAVAGTLTQLSAPLCTNLIFD